MLLGAPVPNNSEEAVAIRGHFRPLASLGRKGKSPEVCARCAKEESGNCGVGPELTLASAGAELPPGKREVLEFLNPGVLTT